MSDLTTNINLHDIQAPGLTSSEYGKDIRDQFKNIDDNFKRVSNRDYVAGQSGSGVYFEERELWNETEGFTTLGCKMLDRLTELEGIDWNSQLDYHQEELAPFAPVTVASETTTYIVYFYDYIKNNPKLTLLYTLREVENTDPDFVNQKYICSPQVYTFMDKRFANIEEGGGVGQSASVQQLTYDGLKDTSCLLTCKFVSDFEEDDAVFDKCNIFPTLYYDKDSNEFKWGIYGKDTGIRAQGAQGVAGNRAAVWLVTVEDVTDPSLLESFPVGYLYSSQSPNPRVKKIVNISVIKEDGTVDWINIYDPTLVERPDNGDVCIALEHLDDLDSDDSDDYLSNAFISQVIVKPSGTGFAYFVFANQQNSIIQNLSLNNLKTMLAELGNPDSGDILGGLFIPYKNGSNVETGAHFAYQKLEGTTNTLNIRPISSVDDSIISNPGTPSTDPNTQLNIKYGKVSVESIEGTTLGIYMDQNKIQLKTNRGAAVNQSINLETRNVNVDSVNTNITGKNIILTTTPQSLQDLNTRNVQATVNGINNVYLGCPIGTIVMWAGSDGNIPDGWLLCDGKSIVSSNATATADLKNTIYDNLYNTLATGIGTGGVKHIPNFQQKFPLGAQDSTISAGQQNYSTKLGKSGGVPSHSLIESEMPRHNHDMYKSNTGSGATVMAPFEPNRCESDPSADTEISTRYTGGIGTSESASDGIPHNNMPPFLAINFIIKYK